MGGPDQPWLSDPAANQAAPWENDPAVGHEAPAAPAGPDQRSVKMRDHVQHLIDAGADQNEIETYVRSQGIDPGRITGLKEALVARGMGAHPAVRLQDLVAGKPAAQVGVREAGTEDTGFLHNAAIIGKGIVQGVSDFNDMMPWSGAAFAHNLGAPSHSEIFDAQLEHAGVAQAQTRGQRIEESAARGVGSALPLGPAAPGAAALNAFAGASAGGAGQLAKEEGYGPGVQFAASLAAGGAPYALKGGVNALATRAAARAPVNALAERAASGTEIMQAAERQNVNVMAADVGGPTVKSATAALAQSPLAVGSIRKGGQRMVNTFGAARDRVASEIGTVSDPQGAGEAAQRGAQAFITASGNKASQMYDAALAGIKPDVPVVVDQTLAATRQTLDQLSQTPEIARVLDSPALKRFRDALATDSAASNGAIPLEAARKLRSAVGKSLDGPTLVDDIPRAALKSVYGALTQDIERAIDVASKTGAAPPGALSRLQAANRMYEARMSRIEGALGTVLGKGEKGAQPAYEGLMRLAGVKGGDPAKLEQIMRSMPADERGIFSATAASRLGDASVGQQNAAGSAFSPSTFLTNWNSLTDRAKAAMFSPQHRAALQDLATVAEGAKESARYSNHSNTGGIEAWINLGNAAAGMGAIGTTGAIAQSAGIIALAGQYLGGKLLASPAAARFVVRIARARTPQQGRIAINALTALAAQEPTLARPVKELQQRLLQSVNDNMPSAAAASDQQQQNKQ